jgi:hypothetical protein
MYFCSLFQIVVILMRRKRLLENPEKFKILNPFEEKIVSGMGRHGYSTDSF